MSGTLKPERQNGLMHRVLHVLHALLHWRLGADHPPASRPEPAAPEAPDRARAKAEIDRWVDELHRAGALDEATLDVFERLIDDWVRQHHTLLEAHRLDQGQVHGRLRAEVLAEISRRDLIRRRAEREYERARAALEAHRGAQPGSTAALRGGGFRGLVIFSVLEVVR